MKLERLVEMANDIGAFFASEADREAAVNAIYLHLRRFWDPRMRAAIVAGVADGNASQLDERVRAAVDRLARDAMARTA